MGRWWDTLALLTFVVQIRADQSVKLMNGPIPGTGLGDEVGYYRIDSGSGTVWSDANGTYYAPPAVVSAPMLTKIVLGVGATDKATAYVEVRPAF